MCIRDRRMTMAEAMKEADVFIGVSAPGVLTPEMVKSMKENPIVFAMANPESEKMCIRDRIWTN